VKLVVFTTRILVGKLLRSVCSPGEVGDFCHENVCLYKQRRRAAMILDCVIIGGSPAGLNAALMLGRAKRTVMVFDDERFGLHMV